MAPLSSILFHMVLIWYLYDLHLIRAVTKIPNIFIFLEADVFGGWLGSEK